MTPDEFDVAFDSFEVSAFRLETLQSYAVDVEDEGLRAFREGLPRPERSVRTSSWMQRIAATTMAGKMWSRVRLVTQPLSEYTRYELVSYAESLAVGEEIRIANVDTHPALSTLGPDFWLFDAGESGEFAIIMRYDDVGAPLGYEQTTDTTWCRAQRAFAWSRSVSLAEYTAQQGIR